MRRVGKIVEAGALRGDDTDCYLHNQDVCWVTVMSIGKAGRTNATEDKCIWHVRPSHFGNPAKSDLLTAPDFRWLCDPRSRGVCLYRLSFKEGDTIALVRAWRNRPGFKGLNLWTEVRWLPSK